ncbi:MAG: TPR repeat protein [Limisphaerales bacterium]|jgi:TPR repeat protein
MYKVCVLLTISWLALTSATVQASNAREDIDRAKTLIASGQYSLARTYLAPALVAPYLPSSERSRAYYFQGFTYAAENMPVSARKDFNRALEFNDANPAALVALGRLHAGGRGTEKNAVLAVELFTKAANLEFLPGQFHLGYAYLMGEGVDKDLLRARDILGQAATQGEVFAMMSLAASYRVEHAINPAPELAEHWYQRASEAGEPKALLALAYMYEHGEVGEPDLDRAMALLQQAAEQGVSRAHVSLGWAYLSGRGVAQDYEKAYTAYRTAANAKEMSAYVGLGHLYEHGLGVAQDMVQAIDWYRRAAELDDVGAQLRLAMVYFRQSTAESRRRAVYWTRLAADSGDAQAQNDYAWMLATSRFDNVRNGTLALDQAEQAVASQPTASFLDTLAAAYAETGNFERAVEVQQQALATLTTAQADLRGELEMRLKYYLRSEPWRE